MNLIDIAALSNLLKVKPKTIYGWVELRQVPFLKINGTIRFDNDEINIWLEACKRGPWSGHNKSVKLGARKGGDNRK